MAQNITDPTAQSPADTSGTNPWDGTIKTAYQQYTGRTPTAQEMIPHYGNPDGLPGVVNTIQSSDEAKKYAASQTPATASPTMPAGIDPRLSSLYQKYKFTPTGQGTGFGDWQYWQDKMNTGGDPDYFLKRLDADLAGTGTDQPTGTVGGNGLWKNSGAADRGQTQGGLPPGASIGPDGMIVFGQAPTDPTQPTAQGDQRTDPQALLKTLLAKYQADQAAKAKVWSGAPPAVPAQN